MNARPPLPSASLASPIAAAPPSPRPRGRIGSLSGALIDLIAPDWRDVRLADVALGLSRLRRWNGQTRRPYSVAEHSRLVARLAPPKAALAALLHDAHEYALGDIATPVAEALERFAGPPARVALHAMKRSLDRAIARAVLEAFAPARSTPEALDRDAEYLADDMVSHAVVVADGAALTIEDEALRAPGRGGWARAKLRGLMPYDDKAQSAAWLAEVKRAAQARTRGQE